MWGWFTHVYHTDPSPLFIVTIWTHRLKKNLNWNTCSFSKAIYLYPFWLLWCHYYCLLSLGPKAFFLGMNVFWFFFLLQMNHHPSGLQFLHVLLIAKKEVQNIDNFFSPIFKIVKNGGMRIIVYKKIISNLKSKSSFRKYFLKSFFIFGFLNKVLFIKIIRHCY